MSLNLNHPCGADDSPGGCAVAATKPVPARSKVHVGPPPVNVADAAPEPVAVVPEKFGSILGALHAALVPVLAPLQAQANVLALVTTGSAVPAAQNPAAGASSDGTLLAVPQAPLTIGKKVALTAQSVVIAPVV
ncbi:MAG: hypothetical protein EAZ30_00090 [Betaproteobacteria bacterium]|nr:MAG: hypothetical protein EAZ30_00090 [Betaproteobacteria bacterium]